MGSSSSSHSSRRTGRGGSCSAMPILGQTAPPGGEGGGTAVTKASMSLAMQSLTGQRRKAPRESRDQERDDSE